MTQRFLTFRDGRSIPNLMISCMDDGHHELVVEFWDVATNFHSLKPLQEDVETNPFYKKYKNKRKVFTREELDELLIDLKELNKNK